MGVGLGRDTGPGQAVLIARAFHICPRPWPPLHMANLTLYMVIKWGIVLLSGFESSWEHAFYQMTCLSIPRWPW